MDLVILDRDGVINEDSPAHIKNPEEWIPLPGSLEAIARLKLAGYRVVVASNQSGVARGLLDLQTLARIHDKMLHCVHAVGGEIDAIFFCPHAPEDNCLCRKPKPGLLEDIAQRLGQRLTSVPVIGDSLRDLQAAQAVQAQPVLVGTGNGRTTLTAGTGLAGVVYYADLATAAQALVQESRGSL